VALDFVCIGAQKAGTTWLYDQLRQLDAFAVTPIKELHYFDRDPGYLSPNYVAITRFRDRLRDPKWYERVGRDIARTIRDKGSLEDFRFLWHWHRMNYSDSAYAGLFDKWEAGKIKGEITPSYSILQKQDIERIYQTNSQVKIIFLLRDPIDRAWSHCRYFKPDVTYSIESMIEFIDGDDSSFRGDYLSTIDKYTSVFPKNQILLAYYDGLVADPQGLLSQIVSFLGGDDVDSLVLNTLSKRSNASRRLEIPEQVYQHLLAKHERQIKTLAGDYGSYAANWLAEHYGGTAIAEPEVLTFHPK